MKIIGNMRISWDQNPYFSTMIEGPDFDEIQKYCDENNLTIAEGPWMNRKGNFIVQAEKPNHRFQVLRKRVQEIPGYKLIQTIPTKKMYWLTYEKVPENNSN